MEVKDHAVAAVLSSVKPPAERVTLTLPILNAARNVAFVVTGAEKAAIVKRVIDGDDSLPAAMVRPTDGRLYWVMDEQVSRGLN
ncbi:unnamed protein product [Soboliphyme baturini]|uniref:Glucosamine_iso domain-containing protein n=1 Tax=Soboliphyme baturini TaxID=241478 RepID=A0A183J9E2_9BILA|nr:unnamed protein product [Soboliphyme baturini]